VKLLNFLEVLEENFKWHLEAFASELFIYISTLQYTSSFTLTVLSLIHTATGQANPFHPEWQLNCVQKRTRGK